MQATTVTLDDLILLRSVMLKLSESGSTKELASLVRIHRVIEDIVCADAFGEDAEDDPELLAALEEADEDLAAGRAIPQEEVMRRLLPLSDG